MKKINIFNAIPVIALAVALVSCEEQFQYTPGVVEDVSKVVVGADIAAVRTLEVAGEDIAVPFVRNTTSGSLEVALFIEDPSNIFSLKSSTLTFADGDSLANALVSYKYSDLQMDTTYVVNVGIADETLVSQYLPSVFPVSCIKAWENLGIGQWFDSWWIGELQEKTVLKSPDGSETYRIVTPFDAATVVDAGFDLVSEMPYIEFSIDDEGLVSYQKMLNLGFNYSGKTCHFVHPSVEGDDAAAANNAVIMPGLVQFEWYPEMNSGANWWGKTSKAWLSLPGGPDLGELLGL